MDTLEALNIVRRIDFNQRDTSKENDRLSMYFLVISGTKRKCKIIRCLSIPCVKTSAERRKRRSLRTLFLTVVRR